MIPNRDRQLYQYRNAGVFNSLINKIYELKKTCAPDNLIDILDIDKASGAWLTQLALIFNVKRSYFQGGTEEDTFVLDLSYLDSSDILDGTTSPMDDSLLRALLKARILRNTSTPRTIDYIYRVFFIIFGDDLDIEVQEFASKQIQIIIDFGNNTNGFRILQALIAEDDGWFGRPTGVQIIYDSDVNAK